MTERELIEGVIQHDRNAVALLVEQYQGKVIKTAYYYLGNMEDAEDLSQEIFVEILRSLPAFRGASSLSSWIYRIAVNRSLNELKRKKRRQLFVNIGQYFRNPDEVGSKKDEAVTVAPDDLEARENQKLLFDALEKLPHRQRTAFMLSKFEELPYREIAGVMNLSVSSVESLLHRAKINLQRLLVRHFIID